MSAYQTDFAHHQRLRTAVTTFLAGAGPKDWSQLAQQMMPQPPVGAPLDEFKLYRAWINYTSATARGHLERQLGRNHPDLAAAQRAIEDRAITVTMPVMLAMRAGAEAPTAAARHAAEAAQIAARIANRPSKQAAARYPITGAKPYHSGSREMINLPDDPIPYAWRDRAMRLIGKLFSITRDGRKQGILKQSGMTVVKSLMLNFANGKTGACYPSYEAIAARTGLGRSTVADAVALLADLGFLDVTNRVKRVPITGRGGVVIGSRPVQTSNSYRLGSGNWLAILSAAPKAMIETVAAWIEEWSQFLRELKALLLNTTESRTRPETYTDILSEGKNQPKRTSHTPLLRRLCRWRTVPIPTILPSHRI